MIPEYDYLASYTESFEPQIDQCLSVGNLELAFFWLNTYKSELERDIQEMSPEMSRACIDHFSSYENEIDQRMTLKMIVEHFDHDKEKIEKYLKRFIRD